MSNGKRSRGSGPDVPAPDTREVPDPPRYDFMQVLQSMMELQKDLSAVATKTDRLIADVGGLSTKVGSLNSTMLWAKGFAVAAVILIPICATVLWWLAGSKIEQMRDELMGIKKPPSLSDQLSPRR
jgi:hypothetical protein